MAPMWHRYAFQSVKFSLQSVQHKETPTLGQMSLIICGFKGTVLDYKQLHIFVEFSTIPLMFF